MPLSVYLRECYEIRYSRGFVMCNSRVCTLRTLVWFTIEVRGKIERGSFFHNSHCYLNHHHLYLDYIFWPHEGAGEDIHSGFNDICHCSHGDAFCCVFSCDSSGAFSLAHNKSAEPYRGAVCYRVREPCPSGRSATGGQKSQKGSRTGAL